jgi:RimJ/RimL family protein N-acetyltransferase
VVALANWEGADTAVLTAEAAVMEALAGARYRFSPADPPPASRLEEYAGSYRLPTGRRYDIEVAGDRLQVYGGDPAPDGHWNPAGFGKQTVGLVDQDWGVVEGDGAVSPLIGFELKDGRTTAVNVGGRWFPKTTWLLESPPERIEVDGYYLRLWRSEDAQALAEALKASIGQIRPWMPFFSQEAFGREAAYVQAWAAAARDGRGFGYGLFRGRDGQLVGGTLVHILPDRPGTFDLGYWIHVDFAGQGLGRSAAGATAEAMLALADVDRMEVQCDESNAPSAAIARSLGCRLETVETLEGGGRLMRWAMEKTVPRKISSDKTR